MKEKQENLEKVEVSEELAGKVLGKSVYKNKNLLLLKEGAILKKRTLQALKNHGIEEIYVKKR